MYLVFKSADQRSLGIVQQIGRWFDYAVGYLPDTHKDVVLYAHLNPVIVSEEVAWAWMFIQRYQDYISVRTGTPQNEKLQVLSSHEATGEKAQYMLTDADKANTVELMKIIMRMRLDEIYDKRMVQMNLGVSALELSTWPQQKLEAELYASGQTSGLTLLESLASARGITLDEMVSKVNSAVQNYNDQIGTMLASKQVVELEIKSCATIADCNRLMHNRFEIEMPAAQREDEGIAYSAKYDI